MRHRRALEIAYANGTYVPPSARPKPPEKPPLYDAYLTLPRTSVTGDDKLQHYTVWAPFTLSLLHLYLSFVLAPLSL